MVFIGFTVTLAAFGETGMLYAMYAYVPNTVMFWTIGYLLIRKDANTILGDKARFRFENLKKLLTPSILTVLIMLALVLLDIKLPPTVIKISEYLGNMTTPLSLIFTGCMIYISGFKNFKYEKGLTAVILGRFVIVPAISFVVCMIIIASLPYRAELYLMRNVFTIQMAMPAMVQLPILAETCGADTKYAITNVAATTLISLITIPVYLILLSVL